MRRGASLEELKDDANNPIYFKSRSLFINGNSKNL